MQGSSATNLLSFLSSFLLSFFLSLLSLSLFALLSFLTKTRMRHKLKVFNIVGARPNFMKMAPIIEAMNRYPERIEHLLVHTGQHYDER